MSKWSVLVVGMFLLVACASESSYQKTTAEFTECSADDIQISDVNASGANSWKAICRNNARIYRCSKQECTEVK